MISKPPWSRRKNRKSVEEFYAPRDGMPDGLKSSLIRFATSYFVSDFQVRVECIEHFERLVERTLSRVCQRLVDMFRQDDEILLDAIDHALQYPWKGRSSSDDYHPKSSALELKSHLADARSVYDVFLVENREHYSPVIDDEHEPDTQATMAPTRGYEHHLGYRQPPEISKLVEDATSDKSRDSEHLRRAW